jgi:hypothetical protein
VIVLTVNGRIGGHVGQHHVGAAELLLAAEIAASRFALLAM